MPFAQVARFTTTPNWDDLEKMTRRAWRGFLALLSTWYMRTDSRRALASQDDRMLRDIGLSREQVVREIHKAFWQA
ncbi:MAG TPA: DUF1127 domain-containing protein [Gammaproteobacteria bacterium]|nr:DUF1127 domain-containing protein [Gammaproteobacteria bacterium]